MALMRFELMWEVISNFEFPCQNDMANIVCVLCQKLLCRPCAAGCGCLFCERCAKAYLNGENKYCPGGKEDCSSEYMRLNGQDITWTRYIAKSIFKCPFNLCSFETELEKMKEHIDVCEWRPKKCPYLMVGCKEERPTDRSINDHLTSEGVNHVQLLMKVIDNLSKKVDLLNQVMREKDSVLEYLAKELNEKNEKIGHLSSAIEMINERVSAEALNANKRIYRIEEEHDAKWKQIVKESYQDLEHIRSESHRSKDEVFRRLASVVKLNGLIPHIEADFVWSLKDFSSKMQAKSRIFSNCYYSDPFYACGYKMCLYVLFHDVFLEFRCFLMKGDKDDDLKWPLKIPVTLSIINQYDHKMYVNQVFEYDSYEEDISAFNKPSKDRNANGIGSSSFITVSDILKNPGVNLQNSVLLTCELNKYYD